MKPFRVIVFGKAGCRKCKVLNSRLDSLLKKENWQDFGKRYVDVETEDGLVEFCKTECINPQRIPALVVEKRSDDTDGYRPVPNPRPGAPDEVCGDSKLYTILGLQTDYTDRGRGVLTPKMIRSVLTEARAE